VVDRAKYSRIAALQQFSRHDDDLIAVLWIKRVDVRLRENVHGLG
jgi:hypothetical protein